MQVSKILGERLTLISVAGFLANLYHSQKIQELFSFIYWEAKYRLLFYEKQNVLSFRDEVPKTYIREGLKLEDVTTTNYRIFPGKEDWLLVFLDKAGAKWATVVGDEATLRQYSPLGEQVRSFSFPDRIECIHMDSQGQIFCCGGGILYKSSDSGRSFRKVLAFSTSSSFFRNDTVAESPTGDLFLGEYANVKEGRRWKFVGYIYRSKDQGETWETLDFLESEKINKHVHILQWSEVIDGLVMTDGDNQKNLWINRSRNAFNTVSGIAEEGWKKINRFHLDKGGYTGFVEADGRIFFGTDYNGGTNFIVSTEDMRNFREEVIPDPYRRSMFNRIILRRNQDDQDEIWASLHFKNSGKVKSLLMVSTDAGVSWERVIEYDGTRFELKIISSSRKTSRELYFLIKDRSTNAIRSYRIAS